MSEHSAELCVVGSFMMDLIAYADRRPRPGETLVGSAFVQSPGGKGFNQAVAAARAGARVAMVGTVGTDGFGDEFVRMLEAEGVSTAGVSRREDVGTGVGLPVVDANGQNSIVIVPRANLAITPDDILRQRSLIESASVILLQLELPLDSVTAAARLGRRAGATVVLNPAPYAPLPQELIDNVDIIIPNEVEFDAWSGLSEPDNETRIAVARQLMGSRHMSALITLGSEGVLVVPPSGETDLIPAHHVTAIDTIGAGDTFCGHFAALLSQGTDPASAARHANAASAIAVTRRGGAASAPTMEEVDDFLRIRV